VWLRPDPRLSSRSLSFRSSENCTFLDLSPPPIWRWAQNWWLIMIIWDLVYSLSEPDFWISFSVSYHWRQTSWNVYYRLSNGYICLLLEARVTWSSVLVVLYVLCMLMWPWPDLRSRSRSCGNDHQPLYGPLLLFFNLCAHCCSERHPHMTFWVFVTIILLLVLWCCWLVTWRASGFKNNMLHKSHRSTFGFRH